MSLIRTPFGFTSTAAEVAAGVDLTGRRVVVTGASSGIGVETVRALAFTGAEVTLAVRDVDAASAPSRTSPRPRAAHRCTFRGWTWRTRCRSRRSWCRGGAHCMFW